MKKLESDLNVKNIAKILKAEMVTEAPRFTVDSTLFNISVTFGIIAILFILGVIISIRTLLINNSSTFLAIFTFIVGSSIAMILLVSDNISDLAINFASLIFKRKRPKILPLKMEDKYSLLADKYSILYKFSFLWIKYPEEYSSLRLFVEQRSRIKQTPKNKRKNLGIYY